MRPDDRRQAAEYRLSMFEAWDMLAGRIHPESGGKEEYLDVIGVNYYDRNQCWNFRPPDLKENDLTRVFWATANAVLVPDAMASVSFRERIRISRAWAHVTCT